MSGAENTQGFGAEGEGVPPGPYPASAWVDQAGTVLLWSAQAQALLGYPAEEVCGTPAVKLLAAGTAREEALALRDRPGAGQCWDGVLALRHRDGHEVKAAVRVRPLADGEGRAGWSVGAGDAGPMEREEIDRAILQALFGQCPILITVLDGELRFHLVNTAAQRAIAPPAERLVGRGIGEEFDDSLFSRKPGSRSPWCVPGGMCRRCSVRLNRLRFVLGSMARSSSVSYTGISSVCSPLRHGISIR